MTHRVQRKILVVEDDRSLNKLMISHLTKLGYDAFGVESGQEARDYLETTNPDLTLLDIRLPDCNGLDLLAEIGGHVPVITITAYGAVDQAVKAVRTGAADYLVKPVSLEALSLSIERVFTTAELKRDVVFWQSQAKRMTDSAIVGNSPELLEMRNLIQLYSAAGSSVLIEGESGTGKELVARALHEASDRADRRFVPIDCDPSEENTILTELFGQEAGVTVGTESLQEGMLEFAHGGTIYLSDIAELSHALQSRILRVLETGLYRRQGGKEDLISDVRIIVGTCHDLRERVDTGLFRSELFFRLSAFKILVPPLRDRGQDVVALAEYFLENRSFQRGNTKQLAASTLVALKAHDWPGNVRELRNAIERGVIVSGTAPEIVPQDLSLATGSKHNGSSDGVSVFLRFVDEPSIEELRSSYLRVLLARYEGNRRKVAQVLGISERNTYRLISRMEAETD